MGVTLKSEYESNPLCEYRSFRMIKSLESTMVTVPPRIVANPTGMSIREREIPVARAVLPIVGRNRAAAPIFCINPDRIPTVDETRPIDCFGMFPAFFTIWTLSRLTGPEVSILYPSTITAITAHCSIILRIPPRL